MDEQAPLLGRQNRSRPRLSFLRYHLSTTPSSVEPALLLQCLTTGLADGLAYSATQTWVGFMTGNLVQLVLAAFSLPDTMRRLLCSLSAIGGFSIGANLAARFQPSRTALIASSILRAALTLTLTLVGIAYADFNLNGERAPVVLALLSISLGIQSCLSSRLPSPLSTTVVFTATLTNVSADLNPLNTKQALRLAGILALLIGAALSQLIVRKFDNSLAFLAAVEIILAATWGCLGVRQNWGEWKSTNRLD